MTFLENISLAPYTTFKIGGPARFLCVATSGDEVKEAIIFAKNKSLPIFVLGGGSNILMSDKGFAGLVIKMEIRGIAEETFEKSGGKEGKTVLVSGAGEIWDDLVKYAVGQGLHGIENLSLIPGTVGAAPIQNIGAYGSEAKDSIAWVEAVDVSTYEIVKLSNEQCAFAYRSSLFKANPGKYIVTRVACRLSLNGSLNLEYRDVAEWYRTNPHHPATIQGVRDAVIAIRTAKLPNLSQWGTAGSFFKNPIISTDRFNALKEEYPELPGYPESDERTKVSLGWILDKVCGAKGMLVGKVGTYEKQSLVLVATEGATADEVDKLAEDLTAQVKKLTGISIEREVESVG